MTRCTICNSAEVVAVDAAINAATSDRQIAKSTGLTRSAIQRHRLAGHVKERDADVHVRTVETFLAAARHGRPDHPTPMQALRSEESLRRTGQRHSSPVAIEIVRSWGAQENRYKLSEAQRAQTDIALFPPETVEERAARVFGVAVEDVPYVIGQALGGSLPERADPEEYARRDAELVEMARASNSKWTNVPVKEWLAELQRLHHEEGMSVIEANEQARLNVLAATAAR